MSHDLVIFEDISSSNFAIFKNYVKQGVVPSVFDWDFQVKTKKHLRGFVDSGQLERIFIDGLSKAQGQAIDLANRLLPYIEGTAVYKSTAALYGVPDVSFLFRRGLAEDIFKFCYIVDHLTHLAKIHPQSKIVFYSNRFSYWHKFLYDTIAHDAALPNNIVVHDDPWLSFKEFIRKEGYKNFALAFVGLRFLGCFLGAVTFKPKVLKTSFDHAVFIGSRLEVERSGDRGYDFLMDGKCFHPSNTAFIDHSGLSDQLIERESSKGYFFYRIKKDHGVGSLAKAQWDMSFFGAIFKSLLETCFSFQEPSSMWRVYFIAMQKFCDWRLILQRINFKNLVFTNQENIQVSAICLFLRTQQKTSWNYSCFLGGTYFIAKDNDVRSVRNVIWSFLSYDHFVGFNQDVIAYYKMHHQNVSNYQAIGSLYGQMIMDKKSQALVIRQECFPKISDVDQRKLIVIFDTTFINADACWTNFDDCLAFYQDMLRLIDAYPKHIFVFKPSKSPTFYCHPDHPAAAPEKGEAILSLWKKIKDNPRVYWPISQELTAKSFVDFSFNNRIIAASDVVITHCMSSPTAEALSARKKAFWYESGHKHQGIDYDQIPGLVVHGYDDLTRRIDALLAMSDQAFDQYLDTYIKGKVDAYLDGQAMLRFKEQLAHG